MPTQLGTLYSLDTACPLNVAPKPVAKASVSNTACLDTYSRETPARRNEGSHLIKTHLIPPRAGGTQEPDSRLVTAHKGPGL